MGLPPELDERTMFADFVLDGRIGRSTDASHDNILRLLYLLGYAQGLSLAEASRALRVSKPLFCQTILPENPLFDSALRPGCNRRGGHERNIILSKKAKEYQQPLMALAEKRLGSAECQKLRIEAGKSRREALRIEKRGQKDEAMRMEKLKHAQIILQRVKKDGPRYEGVLREWSQILKMPPEEIEKELLGGIKC